MKLIGLTGGIASGKSTVAQVLREADLVVLSADQIARDAVQPGQPAYLDIIQTFGPSILQPNQQIDRNRLGQLIFANPELRAQLNAITHPRIAQMAASWIEQYSQQGLPLLVYEVPLLFETHMETMFEQIILVVTPPDIQCQRLQQRDHLSPTDALARIQSQMPLEYKIQRAHILIHNHGSLEELKQAVRVIIPMITSSPSSPSSHARNR